MALAWSAAAPAVQPAPPAWHDLLTGWRLDPLTLALVAVVVFSYVRCRIRGRRQGLEWPAWRDVVFGVGVVVAIWVSNGAAQARADQMEWVWMAQQLSLLLVVPLITLAGQPIALVRRVSGGDAWILRVLDSRLARILGHPLVGPALVPAVFLVLLFGGVGQASVASPVVGWLVHVALLLIGALIALPLVDADDTRTSLAVGLALAIGVVELFMDAFPGIAMRLDADPIIPYFALHTPPWAHGWVYQQHEAGGMLWVVSEVLDVPFLILVAARWLHVDAAEAARIDAELDAAELAAAEDADRSATHAGVPSTGAYPAGTAGPAGDRTVAPAGPAGAAAGSAHHPPADRPWFYDDPQLRQRYR